MRRLHIILRRGLMAVLVFTLVFVFSSVAFSAVFFRVMFARKDSLSEVVRVPYESLESKLRRQEVAFPSGDNVLRGYLYAAENDKGLVIIAPGISSDADAHLAETMRFADSGYAVLAYDATGVCESEGDSRVGLQQSRRDLLAAVDYAANDSRLSDLPVFLYGHSLGAYAAASVLDEAAVEAAVCVSGFDSPVGTMYGQAKGYVGVLADVEYPFLYFQNFLLFGDEADKHALDGVNSGDTPVLIFHGSEDKVVPYDLSLYARHEEFDNPNAAVELIDEDSRSGHSYLWLSEDAAAYMLDLQEQLNDLRTACGGELTDGDLDRFYSEIDPEKATETDDDFMNEVLALFEKTDNR